MLFLLCLLLTLQTFSPAPEGSDQIYHSQPGDTLMSVARSHRLGLEHVAWANGREVDLKPLPISDYRIPLRRIPPRPLSDGLVLNLPERGLYLFQQGKSAGFYPVAIGMPGWETPTGDFTIHERTVNPTWYPPAWAGEAGPIGPGPSNPLGDRWMGLGLRGYGMHATNRPDSIGGALSHGCIRMYPELARELYDRVRVGTPVRIEYVPVKLAWDEQNLTASLAIFPDVYRRCQLSQESQKVLKEAGLTEWVDPVRLADQVKKCNGCSQVVVGEKISISDDQGETRSFAGARWRGRPYCTTALLDAAGLSWQWRGRQLVVQDDTRQFVAESRELRGNKLVEMLPVLEFFGILPRVRWGVAT